jgi:hypothetical protein
MKLKTKLKLLAASLLMASSTAFAGPFILAGTDADDHGSVSGGVNQNGWLFMQRALENIGAGVTNGKTTVAILGSTFTAANAANSAFDLSSLNATWDRANIAVTDFSAFFSGAGAVNINTVGILMMDSASNVTGGVAGSTFTPYASIINSFVGAGGGLFSQANGYDWLTALLPAVSVTVDQNSGLVLTADGNTAFPGLTNADLSAGPWHNWFDGFSPIPTLATGFGNGLTRSVIIGGTGGSITNPGRSVPVPGSLTLLGAGLLGLGALSRKRKDA